MLLNQNNRFSAERVVVFVMFAIMTMNVVDL